LKKWPPISNASTGTVNASPTQDRLVMSMRSAFGSASVEATSGSSVMPQIGQLPGPIWRICGCIGHV
jgi:hypothetical protein